MFFEGYSFWETVVAFLMHNIISLILIVILIIAWKREHLGGFLLILTGIAMVFIFGPTGIQYGTWIMIGIPILPGLLFLMNYYLMKSK